jgi:hypothetical protein
MFIGALVARRTRSLALVVAAGLTLTLAAFALASTARAAQTATYTATETIPIPPASSFAGSSGGDGWAVALSSNAVYNVFHHSSILQVACHLQSDASACWGAGNDSKEITDGSGSDFATSGHPGLWLDQNTGKLYVYATRDSDDTGGVVCIDTTQPASAPGSALFCGFTALTGVGEASSGGNSGISAPALVGTRWYAFNFFSGAAPGAGTAGTENKLMCFDVSTLKPCAGQPYALSLAGTGTVSASNFPPPAVAAIGSQVIVPVTLGGIDQLACFNGSTQSACAGSWPAQLSFSYDSSAGAPFPLLNSNGTLAGLCLPIDPGTGTDPCFSLAGAAAATPTGLTGVVGTTSGWNGPAFVLGPRVYLPDGVNDQVDCFDYSTNASCPNFPKKFVDSQGSSTLSLLYTVNADPQRPTCIWVNSDNGTGQIQNFDAFTGGTCGEGAIRVLASSLVVPTQLCTPSGYGSLQVLSPARSTYANGTVAFQDFDANSLGIADRALDASGSVPLDGLNLNANGLPQFLITLNGQSGTPGSVVVKLTWTGVYDPSCVKTGTTVQTSSHPAASTGKPKVNSTTSAAFSGSVNPGGLPTRAFFQYGLDRRYITAGASGPQYDHSTPAQLFPGDSTAHAIQASVRGLVPNAIYHVRLVATNSQGTSVGPDVVFRTPKDPAPKAPKLGKSINVSATGLVFFKRGGVFVPLTELRQLPAGTVFNALHGTLTLITAAPAGTQHATLATNAKHKAKKPKKTKKPKTQTGKFGGAVFKVTQAHSGLATLALVEGAKFKGAPTYASCKTKKGKAVTAALSKRTLQLLRGRAHGKFRTKGRYSAATIRGTIWTIADRCDGTLTHAIKDTVTVNDLVLHKTITLRPGHSYLALAHPPKPKKHKQHK